MLEIEEGIEIGRYVHQSAWIACWQYHDGNGVTVSLGHAAKGILRTRPELHGKHAYALTRSEAAHSVGHVQARALLSHDDGANVGLGCLFDNRIDGIADEE